MSGLLIGKVFSCKLKRDGSPDLSLVITIEHLASPKLISVASYCTWLPRAWHLKFLMNLSFVQHDLARIKSKCSFKDPNYSCTPVIWNPSPPHPPQTCGDILSVWVWKPVKFPDTGVKIQSEAPTPGYSAVQTKVPCVELAVTAFLKSSQQILIKEEKVNASYAKKLCQMFKLPSGAKMWPPTN